MYVVYCHTNLINGKKYIGMTNNVKRRWRSTGAEYKTSKCFYNAILKYGWDNFKHEIIVDKLTEIQAQKLEKYYIKLYTTCDNTKGYNISEGGNGGRVYREHPRNMLGKSQTDYQKEHQREFMLDKNNNPMSNGSCEWGITHEHPRGMKGKNHTPEHNKMISNKMKQKGINCKPVIITFPSGETKTFRSMGEAQIIGLTKPVLLKILRSKKPYEIKTVNQHTEKIKHLIGITVTYLENTEVTN